MAHRNRKLFSQLDSKWTSVRGKCMCVCVALSSFFLFLFTVSLSDDSICRWMCHSHVEPSFSFVIIFSSFLCRWDSSSKFTVLVKVKVSVRYRSTGMTGNGSYVHWKCLSYKLHLKHSFWSNLSKETTTATNKKKKEKKP